MAIQTEAVWANDERQEGLVLAITKDGSTSLVSSSKAAILEGINEDDKEIWGEYLVIPLPSAFQDLYERDPRCQQDAATRRSALADHRQEVEREARLQETPLLQALALSFQRERAFLSGWMLSSLRKAMVDYLLAWLVHESSDDVSDSVTEVALVAEDGAGEMLFWLKTAQGKRLWSAFALA